MPQFQSLKKGILYIANSFPMGILFSFLKKKIMINDHSQSKGDGW